MNVFRERCKNPRGVRDGDMTDGVSELMGTVAQLRLKLALEELQTRSSSPAVSRRLLEDLLIKVGHSCMPLYLAF